MSYHPDNDNIKVIALQVLSGTTQPLVDCTQLVCKNQKDEIILSNKYLFFLERFMLEHGYNVERVSVIICSPDDHLYEPFQLNTTQRTHLSVSLIKIIK